MEISIQHLTRNMYEIMKFKTKEEAILNKNRGDRLFYDPYIDEYFIIPPRKRHVWKEEEFEENFVIMPETFEECTRLRIENCQDCKYLPSRQGNTKYCQRKKILLNRENMEVF